MVRVAGFDPAASASRTRRSTKLSYTLMAVARGIEPRFLDRQSSVLPMDDATVCLGRLELPRFPTATSTPRVCHSATGT